MNGTADLAAAAVGAALVGGAFTWRLTARRGARNALRRALRSESADSRLAALHIVASEGVAAYSGELHERAVVETDPELRRALARVVARAQWEPAADQSLIELRLWAHRELASPEPESTGSTSGTESTGSTSGTESAGEPGGEPIEARPPVEPQWWSLVRTDSDPTTVLVTGAGGPAGVAVVRWLRGAGHRVVAADSDPLAAGLRLGDAATTLESCDSPYYAESLCETARKLGVCVVVPTIAGEMIALGSGQELLQREQLCSVIPEPERVLDCVDKWRFAKVTQAAGIPVPSTNLGSADGVPGPWIVKPRFGRGSRDVIAVDDQAALAYAIANVPDPIVQTRSGGSEFTVDALVSPSGELIGAVPRWRLQTRGGISTRGETFTNERLVSEVARLLGALELIGAANVQGFVRSDSTVCFIEVNPRFSGGLPLSLAAGADLVGEYVRGARGMQMRPER
ncbi:MAG: ATP-grasp domain-containing protein, partial [Acidimicrobiales bacterium]